MLFESDALESLILGRSAAIVELRREIRLLARSSARAVLVLGETGAGKDLVARGLNACGVGSAGRFEVFNCPAVPADHLEAELFGTARGAFPGAIDRQGAAERAGNGLLAFDEIGAMSVSHQGKILRLLENGEGCRLGGTRSYPVRATFVASTNEDLVRAISEGRFRQDLYYRLLQDAVLRVPALRDRPEDLDLLAHRFLSELPRTPALEPGALSFLRHHTWPGNVRELRAVLRAAAHLGSGARVGRGDVERSLARIRQPLLPESSDWLEPRTRRFHSATHELQRRLLVQAFEAAEGNQTRAGVMLGLHERASGLVSGELDSRARKLAQRMFSYWWHRLDCPRSADRLNL